MSTALPDDYPLALRYMYYLPIAEGSLTELEVQFTQYATYMGQSAPQTAMLCAKLFGVTSCITNQPIHTMQDAIEHLAQASDTPNAIAEAKVVTDKERAYARTLEGYARRREATAQAMEKLKDARARKKLAIEQVTTLWNEYIEKLKEEYNHIRTRSPEKFL